MSGDCVLWHQSGYGGVSHSHGKLTVSGSPEQNRSARFYETASNLLELSLAEMTGVISVNMNGDDPTNARVAAID